MPESRRPRWDAPVYTEAMRRLIDGPLPNFRDLGGLATTDGRRTKQGLVFRSSSLQEITGDVFEILVNRLGISSFVDLRAPFETESRTPTWADATTCTYQNFPFTDGFYAWSDDDNGAGLLDDAARMETDDVVRLRYREYLDRAAGQIVAALLAVARTINRGEPSAVFCTYGKDRTGVFSALLLALVDVDPDEIVRDYAASADAMPQLMESMAHDPVHGPRIADSPSAIYEARNATMAGFLDDLDHLGGAQRWAQSHGMGNSHVDALRATFIVTE